MLIKRIKINNLFGMFNYDFDLNIDKKITILYGPNGIGKTVILNLINNIFNKEFDRVTEIKFDKICFYLDNNSSFEVDRNNTQIYDSEMNLLNFTFKKGKKIKQLPLPEYYYMSNNRESYLLYKRSMLKKELKEGKISVEEYDVAMEELYMLRRYPHPRNRVFYAKYGDFGDKKDEFDKIFEEYIVKTNLTGTKRLIKEKKEDDDRGATIKYNRVLEYSEDLAMRITKALKQYSILSQEKDRTFPARIIKQSDNIELDANSIKTQLSEIENKRQEYEKLGLLDKNDEASTFSKRRELSATKLGVLQEYINDNREKLKILEELALRITKFREIISKRFSNKTIYFNSEKGFYFKNSKGDEIDTINLSSGEQHEIIMFYNFLFNMSENNLQIIDEPELSLHIAWQIEFLKDYMNITKDMNNHLLIATHSPQLINDYWDLCIDLEEKCEHS